MACCDCPFESKFSSDRFFKNFLVRFISELINTISQFHGSLSATFLLGQVVGITMVKETVAIIPAFNEELTIGSVVLKTRRYVDEVIVVDDGSSDRTEEVSGQLSRFDIKLGLSREATEKGSFDCSCRMFE